MADKGYKNILRLEGTLGQVDYFPPREDGKPEFAHINVHNEYGTFPAVVFGHRAKFIDKCVNSMGETEAKWRILGRLMNTRWLDQDGVGHVDIAVQVIRIDPILFDEEELRAIAEEFSDEDDDDDDDGQDFLD